MNFKYVPILRNLTGEIEAIANLNLSDKIIPLIEIVKEKPKVNSKDNFVSFNKKYLGQLPNYFFVDIPMYINITKKTKNLVKNFLSPIYSNQITRTSYLNALSSITPQKMIPVVSYNPNDGYVKNIIMQQTSLLRPHFKKIGFRVFAPCSNEIIEELKKVITEDDIILLDIGNRKHTDKSLQSLYSTINSIKHICNCKTVIIHHALTDEIKNTGLIDNNIVPEAITDLLSSYNTNYHFDAFGDFAGIKVPSLEDIPVSSPAYIHYYNLSNQYIGFKGVFKQTSTFQSMILPKYTNSKYWSSLSNKHKTSCHGCKLIQDMLNGNVKVNYATRWKTLTICHYIRSVDEIL